MKLYTSSILLGMVYSFIGFIIYVGEPWFHCFWQSIFIYGKSVILRSDYTFSCQHVFTGLVLTSMTVLHLVGFCSECMSEDLISEAYSKYRYVFSERFFCLLYSLCIESWISWSIRDKDTIKLI